MEAVYGFPDFQKEALDFLLSERSAPTGLIESTAIANPSPGAKPNRAIWCSTPTTTT